MDFDPRDRDDDARDVEMSWVGIRDPDLKFDDLRDRNEDTRERDVDPRDVFVEGLDYRGDPNVRSCLMATIGTN